MIDWIKTLISKVKQRLAYRRKLKEKLKELEKLDPYDYK